jgi:hypothetical protein
MLDRYDAWSKFKASPESCVNLFALGQSNTRGWLTWRLPLVLANRVVLANRGPAVIRALAAQPAQAG